MAPAERRIRRGRLPPMSDVTRLLDALREGDEDASDQLVRAVYGELRRLAAAKLRQERSRTLGATALVHEAWMRISSPGADGADAPPALEFENRAHFLGAAAEAMRRILIERARRRRSAVKRSRLDAFCVITIAVSIA